MLMKDRIKQIRKNNNLTQQRFAERIGVKQNTVAQYEMGRNIPIDSVISLICREFNINEEWLRTGNGEMTIETTRKADIARLTKQLLHEEDDSFKNRFITMLSKLSVEDWELLESIAKQLYENSEHKNDNENSEE